MRTGGKAAFAAAAVASAGILTGGVFAAGITNFTASSPFVAVSSTTECFDDVRTAVSVGLGPSWDDTAGSWGMSSARVVVDDSASGAWVNCSGQTITVTALDTVGDEMTSGSFNVATDGNIDEVVQLASTVDAYDISGWAIAIHGPGTSFSILTFYYPVSSMYTSQVNSTFSPVTSGVGNPIWAVSGDLPDGVSFDTASGAFTGPASYELSAQQVSVGNGHSCALVSSSVHCWGLNGSYQVGGTASSQATPQAAVLTGASDVSAGGNFSCAVVSGEVKCWGGNENGQLGIGSYGLTNYSTPQTVTGLSTASAVSAGPNYACAIDSGVVKCWGANQQGQVGVGSSTSRYLTPTAINLSGYTAVAISTGTYHACMVTSTDQVYCWGLNNSGELGLGDDSIRRSPTLVGSGVDVAAGFNHTCLLTAGGEVKCAGAGSFGQLGGGNFSDSDTFVQVPSLSATSVSAGKWFTCATTDSETKCWGYNNYGQLGNASTTTSNSPVTAVGIGAGPIALGTANACTVDGGLAKCWGQGNYGANGNAHKASSALVPEKVTSLGWPANVQVTASDDVSGETYDTGNVTLNLYR